MQHGRATVINVNSEALSSLARSDWARLSLVSVQRLGCWLGLFRTWGRILRSRLDTIVSLKYGKTLLSFVYRLALWKRRRSRNHRWMSWTVQYRLGNVSKILEVNADLRLGLGEAPADADSNGGSAGGVWVR